MPSPNKALGPPQNTHGDKIAVGVQYLGNPHIPTYWGDDQILSEAGVYSKPKLPDNAPLHIPRVVRFLYGYGSSVTNPPELNAISCGCTTLKDCPTKDCTWVLVWKKFEVGYVVNPSSIGIYSAPHAVGDTGPEGHQSFHLYPNVGTRAPGAADGVTIQIWSSEGNVGNPPDVYNGSIEDAPGMDKLHVYHTRWKLECVDKDTGDPVPTPNGCPDQVDHVYAVINGEPSSTPICDPGGKIATWWVGTTFGTSQFGVNPHQDYWNIFTIDPNFSVPFGDYPMQPLWEGSCIDEEYPC